MSAREKLIVISHIYNLCALLVLLIFFIVYCIQDREFLLHLAGIIFTLPALAYCIYMVSLDLKAYQKQNPGK
jgi:hypothetical protein